MKKSKFLKYGALIFLAMMLGLNALYAQSNEDCMMCHEDTDLTTERNGKEVSVFCRNRCITQICS